MIAEIETRSGLIHHENFGLLSERPGHKCDLSLATAYLGIWLVCEMNDAEEIEHLLRDLDISRRRGGKEIDVRCSAHQNDIANGEREKSELGLRHVAEDTGEPPA